MSSQQWRALEANAAAIGERLDRQHDEDRVEERLGRAHLGEGGDYDQRGEDVQCEESAAPPNLAQRPNGE